MKRILAIVAALILIVAATGACTKLEPKASERSSASQAKESSSEVSAEPSVSSKSKASSESSASSDREADMKNLIDQMSLTEQVSQMFIISLGPKASKDYAKPTEAVTQFLKSHQPGGYVLFAGNITTVEGTRALTDTVTELSRVPPFIGIDEEGGMVSRLYSAGLPGYEKQPTAASIGQSGDTKRAYDTGAAIGEALASIGVNLNFAPDADVLTNPDNQVIGTRSFGSDAALVSDMVSAFQKGLRSKGIMSAPKHFPGHGGTEGDSHEGIVSIDYDKAHLESVEYKPFVRAIGEGAEFVLVGHITAPNVDKSGLPATLSPYFVTDVLRRQLGFRGITITDAMDMGAIADNYTAADASVKAVQAGIDVILMPKDYPQAVDGIVKAVDNGIISKERIRQSVERIIRAKVNAGLI